MRRYRELMRLNDILEEDLRVLKETDFMGPTTRAEYNRRKAGEPGPSISNRERRRLKKTYDSSSLEQILQQPKSEQLRIMRVLFDRQWSVNCQSYLFQYICVAILSTSLWQYIQSSHAYKLIKITIIYYFLYMAIWGFFF